MNRLLVRWVVVAAGRNPRRRAHLSGRVAALSVAVALGGTLGAVAVRHDEPGGPTSSSSSAPARARVVPPGEAGPGQADLLAGLLPPDVLARPTAAELAEAQALLDRRAGAISEHDRTAFLATLDPDQPDFVRRQGAVFDALAAVPLSSWAYSLDTSRAAAATPDMTGRYATRAFSAAVTLRYGLRGVDPRPSAQVQGLTFVRRGGIWLLGGDADRPDQPSARGLWDFGPVVAVRGTSSLVLGHPGQLDLLRRTAAEADDAVGTVTSVWGRSWPQRVAVLVPAAQDELRALVPDTGDLTAIAALSTADLDGPAGDRVPVGARIVLNPATWPGLSPTGRRVVLTHEVTHVATRPASGPRLPVWLAEGYADHVGYTRSGVAVTSAARELAADVRAGHVPAALPTDEDFDGANPALPQAYEASWLACELIGRRWGEARLQALLRAAGSEPVSTAVPRVLGVSLDALTKAWQADLRSRLGVR